MLTQMALQQTHSRSQQASADLSTAALQLRILDQKFPPMCTASSLLFHDNAHQANHA
jgi:hypothetical protein